MGWNGSNRRSENNPAAPRRAVPKNKGHVSPVHFAIAGVILVAVIIALIPQREQPSTTEKSPNRHSKTIQERTGKIVKPTATEQKAQPLEKQLPPQRIGEIRNGYRLLPSGRLHKVMGVIEVGGSHDPMERIFKEPSDQLIAGLLTVETGGFLIGDSAIMYQDFAEQFEASLRNPIEYDKDDDEETRELKMAVAATRQELLDRRKAGEDITQVMVETRKQYQELALYRDEMKEQVEAILKDKPELTEQDLDDLVNAANEMLKDRGVEKLLLTEPLKHMFREIEESEAE